MTEGSTVPVGKETTAAAEAAASIFHSSTIKGRIVPFLPDRYLMVFLCALCTCINYADRVNMSVTIISMSVTYSFTLKQQSMVLSSFFLGYIPMQIGGAVLCRRLGAKAVLAYGAFLWSIFTFLTPFAGDGGLTILLACRVFMGLAEGVAFPSVYHFLSSWIPSHERGRAVALFLTGAHVGTVLALIVSPYIIRILDWRYVFYIFGSVGIGWIVAWQLIAYDRDHETNPRPDDIPDSNVKASSHVRISTTSFGAGEDADDTTDSHLESAPLSRGESLPSSSSKDNLPSSANNSTQNASALPNSSTHASTTVVSSPTTIFTNDEWRIIHRILMDKSTLGVCISQSIFAMIHYVILSWLPTYFKQVFGINAGSLSFTFIPYAAMALAANAGGFISDSLIKNGSNITAVRKNVTIIASLGAAISLLVFARMDSVAGAIAAASVSMAFMSVHSGGFESAYLDLASPKSTGIFKAVSNTLASCAGFVAVPLSTTVLELLDGSWRWMFASLSILHVLHMVVFCSSFSAKRVLTDEAL